ncbi:hypothetical protein Hokovirus_2_76 [Hokovirus HKV1]|uniref:Uncharacterized protein n=1 Tax=Hokovirus HKV1 TaxID=1977638 RepID=A0A1V0SFP9_9VIRU|nr:hypothetical protein Hokovirus_2_76 [Hokovirus HKV1]
MSLVGKCTQNMIDTICIELKKKETQQKLDKEILTPLIEIINNKIKYYYIIFIILQIIIIILLVIILKKS